MCTWLLIDFPLLQCDPNLAVFAMWANCMDPNMPRLALFAQRDIHVGEELTFDYASSKTGNFW